MPKNKFDYTKHWKEMPEFIQEKERPFSKIIIRFETEQDLKEFSELIGQPLTPKTKSIWHPKLERGKNAGKKYIDEPTDLPDIHYI